MSAPELPEAFFDVHVNGNHRARLKMAGSMVAFQLEHGVNPMVAALRQLANELEKAANETGTTGEIAFFMDEMK